MPATPYLISLATAVPPVSLAQDQVAAAARTVFDAEGSEINRLAPTFANAGIETRKSPMPLDWLRARRGWASRQRAFVPHALELLERAAQDCLARAGLAAEEVDALVVACSSGIATPSLDALLLDRLPFRRDVRRLPIFGLGCAGGVLGLARAAELAAALPGSRVLFLSVELCTLTFRPQDQSKANIIASALFGDGAAAALIAAGAPAEGDGPRVELTAAGEHTWPDSAEVMGWRVEDDGLGVVFSPEIPRLILREFAPAAERFLDRQGLSLAALDGYVLHPGGEKVVGAFEKVLGLQHGGLRDSREVLRRHGNMSAPTALFVLRRALDRGCAGRLLMAALGPGFTAGFLLLDVTAPAGARH